MRMPDLPVSLAVLALATALPAQLAGAYLVGPGGNYTNLAAAVADLNLVGVAGPVTFLVSANDTGPWTINAFPGQGAANPVSFEAFGGPITLSGTQPVLTLNGCAAVTFHGFSGTYTNTPNAFLVNAGTADCGFTGCNFLATVGTSGAALFNLAGGTGTRIEDCTFGGSYEALNVGIGATGTLVQRCRITGGGWWIMRLAGPNTTLVNNFITGTSNYGISAGISGNTGSGANLKIHHNSIYIAHPSAGSQYCSLRWYSNAASTEVFDNIFYDYYPSVTTSVFNMWCSSSYRPAQMNYNCFFSNQPTYVPFYASANRTFAQWQGLGFDANSLQADPMYTAPTATPADLTLQPGSLCSATGTLLPTVPLDYFLMPRTPGVSIGAHEQDNGIPAMYVPLGAGCAGSVGVPSNTASAPPRLGTNATITFGNLPAPEMAIAIFGLSNTTSAFGPLPLSLSSFGAPGCSARVSAEATVFLLGSGNAASLVMGTPNDPGLMGFSYFTQALVLDPQANAMGASISDAAQAVVGI